MVTRTDKALYAALFAILLWLVVYPNAFILVRSFFPAKQFTLANYQNFFGSEAQMEALWNSLIISAASVLLSALIGIPLAFLFYYFDCIRYR